MGKAKQNKKKAQIKRRQMIEEVFKKSKKAREVAKKFDDKIAQRQGSNKKREKFQEFKRQVSTDTNKIMISHYWGGTNENQTFA